MSRLGRLYFWDLDKGQARVKIIGRVGEDALYSPIPSWREEFIVDWFG